MYQGGLPIDRLSWAIHAPFTRKIKVNKKDTAGATPTVSTRWPRVMTLRHPRQFPGSAAGPESPRWSGSRRGCSSRSSDDKGRHEDRQAKPAKRMPDSRARSGPWPVEDGGNRQQQCRQDQHNEMNRHWWVLLLPEFDQDDDESCQRNHHGEDAHDRADAPVGLRLRLAYPDTTALDGRHARVDPAHELLGVLDTSGERVRRRLEQISLFIERLRSRLLALVDGQRVRLVLLAGGLLLSCKGRVDGHLVVAALAFGPRVAFLELKRYAVLLRRQLSVDGRKPLLDRLELFLEVLPD